MDITWYYKHMKPWQYLVEHKKIINKINNDENVSSLEVDVVQRNLVDNQYQQKLGRSNTIKRNKSYVFLLNVEPSTLVFLKTYNTEFNKIIIALTYQNGRPLEIKDKVNLKLLINYQKWHVIL